MPIGKDDQRHILIDCGVHAIDLGSIQDAVEQMAADCGTHLSLVIMTHRHADHISGFAKCAMSSARSPSIASGCPGSRIPNDETAIRIQTNLTALASQLSLQARGERRRSGPLAAMVENITGGMAASGGSSNQKALDVLHGGFKNKVDARLLQGR